MLTFIVLMLTSVALDMLSRRLWVSFIACVGVVETNSSDSVGKAARLLKGKGVPEALRAKLRTVAHME